MQFLIIHWLMTWAVDHQPLASSPRFIFLVLYGKGYLLGNMGSAVTSVSPPIFLHNSSLAHWQGSKKRQKVFDRVSTAQQKVTCYCIINIILALNPKHSIIPAAKKKINCIPSETRTMSNEWWTLKGNEIYVYMIETDVIQKSSILFTYSTS